MVFFEGRGSRSSSRSSIFCMFVERFLLWRVNLRFFFELDKHNYTMLAREHFDEDDR